ncbi:hypothetical protein ACFGVS_26755 [Mucilaginibacter sp. AW1-7]|jgi:hypothetical protein|uniref:hypothetical protein n=1 Tax=Mucilaginibacter sp. AW1-7 TaxID=3349874 RepID=UPI003F73EEE5
MEERKTAAVVLGIIALIVIFFTVMLPAINDNSTQTLAFKNCAVHFKYNSREPGPDLYRASQNKLAHCLCKSYQQNPDTAVGNHIIKIYLEYGNHYGADSVRRYKNIDSIIKHRNDVLDTLVLVD